MTLITADFPTWFRTGCYGGLACSLIAAAGVAVYALARRRGTPRQLAGTMFGCLAAAISILPAIIWSQTRLDLQGPALSVSEVLLWLAWVAVIGWMLPLGSSAGFLLMAAPFDARTRQRLALPVKYGEPTSISREERRREPLGPGIAWGRLTHLDGSYANQQIMLSRQIILLGRERDNDIVLEAVLASRYHAELHLERGKAYLKDCGSMNGTSVNGQKVWGLAPLQQGDVLDIGGQRFRYEDLLPQSGSAVKALLPPPRDADPHNAETAALPALVGKSEPAAPLHGRLLVNGGPGAGTIVEVTSALLTIGRGSECDVVIPDASISRRHVQIIRQESGLYVQDLGSRNGTAINGQRLSAPCRLEDGDTLTVGNIPLRYVVERPADQPENQQTERLPSAQRESHTAEEPAQHSPNASQPLQPSTPGARGRESHAPLRLPSRKLEQPLETSANSATEPEVNNASIQLSNNTFRPHRLIANRVYMSPPENPPDEQS
ncbi:MAG TPA: FHA domain-containing protein [Ktedonobacterales bacterium]